ncbi:MAG TPA: hypothetical protein PLR50_08160 [Candidatus Rifleibacterium sp.]|nr:hypothetical protein [Candidatus Rifleibacterium sp.]
MIRIRPTTESALSAATYSVDLPGEIAPTRARSQKITTTLDGGAAVTSWAKNNAGATQTVTLTVTEAAYKKLLLIVNHATVFEWLVMCEGRHFLATIDVAEPVSVYMAGMSYKRLDVTFVITEEIL